MEITSFLFLPTSPSWQGIKGWGGVRGGAFAKINEKAESLLSSTASSCSAYSEALRVPVIFLVWLGHEPSPASPSLNGAL